MIRTVATIAVLLTAAYLLLLLFARLFANRFMFAPPEPTYFECDDFFKIPSGEKIAVSYLENKDAEYFILYCHGNGEDLGMVAPLLDEYRKRLNAEVMSFDYCGYGLSSGTPTEENLDEASDGAWKFLTEKKGAKPEKIVLVGYSLGSAGAAHLALKHQNVRGAIIIGGVAKGAMTIFPFNPIPWDILNNEEKWKSINLPLLLLHGTSDAIVPVWNAHSVFESARGPKRAVFIRNCGHLKIFEKFPEIYWGEIEKFLKDEKHEKSSVDYF